MKIEMNIPANVEKRVEDAFAKSYGYSDTIPDPNDPNKTVPNPQTKAQFLKQKIGDHIREVVKGHEANVDVEKVRKEAVDKADRDITVS